MDPLPSLASIGQRIRHLRKQRGLSQIQLASLVGISQGSLSLLEVDRTHAPMGETLAGLCRALQTTPEFLMQGFGDGESIDLAMDEHRLMHLWRALPANARQLVLERVNSVARSFGIDAEPADNRASTASPASPKPAD